MYYKQKEDYGPFLPEYYEQYPYDLSPAEEEEIKKQIDPFNKNRTLNLTNISEYLGGIKGYMWDMDGQKWYKLMPSGLWKPTNEDYISQDARWLIREFNKEDGTPTDVMKKNDFINLLGVLKSVYNTEALKKDAETMKESFPEYDFKSGAIHIKDGWINMATGDVVPECGAFFDLNPYNVSYEGIPEELIKEYTISKGPHQGKTYEQIYAGIIPDDATREYYFYWVGSYLFGKDHNHILVIVGDAETGKTALTKGPAAILDKRASFYSINQIASRFGKSGLVGKKINFSNEIQDEKPTNASGDILKEISDGGIMSIEEKYKAPREVLLEVGLMMTGNRVPELNYGDSGIKRRLRIIRCNEKQKSSDYLHDLLTSEEGKNWLFNRCLCAWLNARENHKTAEDMISLEMINNENNAFYNRDGFIQYMSEKYGTFENCDEIQNRLMEKPAPEIYNDYCNILSNSGEKPLTFRKFNDRVYQKYGLILKPVPVDSNVFGVSCKKFYRPEKAKKRPKKTTNPALRTTTEDKDSDRLAEQFAKEHGLKEYDLIPADTQEFLTEWFISKGYATNDRIWIGPNTVKSNAPENPPQAN